jgi:hypothetical protein
MTNKVSNWARLETVGVSVVLLLVFGYINASAVSERNDTAISPTGTINLLSWPRSAFHLHLSTKTDQDRSITDSQIFIWNAEGHLLISGQRWGYIRTKDTFRDYHVVVEYRYVGPTSGSRSEKARDSGLLLHAFGADGSRGTGTWIPCIEVQIMEGATGDFIVLGPKDDAGNTLPLQLRSTGTKVAASDRLARYDPKGEPVHLPGPGAGHNILRWNGRDPNYQEVKGWRGPGDVEHETGTWNRLDVICDNDSITVYVNGHFINKGWNCMPTAGWIGLQSEGAEVAYRRWTLHPLGGEKIPRVASKQ